MCFYVMKAPTNEDWIIFVDHTAQHGRIAAPLSQKRQKHLKNIHLQKDDALRIRNPQVRVDEVPYSSSWKRFIIKLGTMTGQIQPEAV